MFHRKKFPPEIVYLFVIFLLFFLLNSVGLFKPLRGLVEKKVVVPAREKVYSLQRFFKKDLGECGKISESEVAGLKIKIAALSEEITAQKKLLSAPLPKNWRFLAVKVIGQEGEVFLIDAGRKDGIIEGMTALFEGNYLGKVFSVSEEIALVKLPSFYDEKTVVFFVKGEETTGRGLLVGRGEGRMKGEQIYSSEAVEEGNLVAVDVLGGSLLTGKVISVTENKAESFKTVQVERLFNPENLRTVFLITGKI